MTIKEAKPIRTFYPNGSTNECAVREFILTNGIDTLVAVAFNDLAKATCATVWPAGTLVSVRLHLDIREWQTKESEKRLENRVIIVDIVS